MPFIRMLTHKRRHCDSFSNYRDWRAFLAAVQAPAAYASVATALKAGHAWLSGSDLASGKTLGV
jgi:hypothetical protein